MFKKIIKFIFQKYDDGPYCIYKIFGIKIITKPLRLQINSIIEKINILEKNMRDELWNVGSNVKNEMWNIEEYTKSQFKYETDKIDSLLKLLYIHNTSLALKSSRESDFSNYSIDKAVFAFNSIENKLKEADKVYDIYKEYRNFQTKYSILQDTYRYKNKKKIFYLQTPEHGNIGDHAICYASKKLLNDLFPDKIIIDYTYNDLINLLCEIKKIISDEDIICLPGGGNLGNLYINEEEVRRSIIKEFSKNRIIIFPQSIYFTNDAEGCIELKKSQIIYNNHDSLTIFARDEKSFKLAKEYFYSNEVVLMPDIALYLEDYYCEDKKVLRNDVLFLMRCDKERITNDTNIDNIMSYLKDIGIKFSFTDTEINREIGVGERENVIINILNKISTHRLVITDRFHGVIFSVITRTPCIVFDSLDHKITYGIKWFKDLDFICHAGNYSLDDLNNKIKLFLGDNYKVEYNSSFKKLISDTFLNHIILPKKIIIDNNSKIFHISIDDCIDILKDITKNKNIYTSIFENNILKYFKYLNSKYGVCVSLYLFYNYNDFKLSDMTDKFKNDFESNFHWLKLGFHGYGHETDYSLASQEEIKNDYTLVTREIIRITGTEECIDKVVRLHCYKLNIKNAIAIKNMPFGIAGLLSADDGKNSYYLDKNENMFLNSQYVYKDTKNDILFFKTNIRLENIVNIDDEIKNIDNTKNLIIFTHENNMLDKNIQNSIEFLCEYALKNNYYFTFPMYNSYKFDGIKNEAIEKFIDVFIPITTCNLRCSYCYVTQSKRYNEKLPEFKYLQKQFADGLSKERLGGTCLINMCADGETLLHPYVIDLIKELLIEGHFIWIVTNGTLKNRFDSIMRLPKNLLIRLGFKFSFHYLELLRLNKLNDFFENVKKVKNAGSSFSVEITPHDELIDKIEEIKNICYKEFGALCHITVARDDISENKEILTKLPYEEYKKVWETFNSDLFNFKLSTWNIKRKEFCYAGISSFVLNIGTGELKQCYSTEHTQNIFAKIDMCAIGEKCHEPHCYNAHAFLTLGNIPSLKTPYYYEMRNRVCQNGSEWLNPYMKQFLSHKLLEEKDNKNED